MNILISPQPQPNLFELKHFFEVAFLDTDEKGNFLPNDDQSLGEWFSVEEMIKKIPAGQLIEARAEDGSLAGAVFVGKQNTISWPDGKKMEIFILGVKREFRNKGVARKLISEAENFAAQNDSKKVILNTHIEQTELHIFYQKLGYQMIGILNNYYDNGHAVFFQKTLK